MVLQSQLQETREALADQELNTSMVDQTLDEHIGKNTTLLESLQQKQEDLMKIIERLLQYIAVLEAKKAELEENFRYDDHEEDGFSPLDQSVDAAAQECFSHLVPKIQASTPQRPSSAFTQETLATHRAARQTFSSSTLENSRSTLNLSASERRAEEDHVCRHRFGVNPNSSYRAPLEELDALQVKAAKTEAKLAAASRRRSKSTHQ